MSYKELRQLAVAVSFLFATLGPLSMLMDDRILPGSWLNLIVSTVSSGLFAGLLILTVSKPRRMAAVIVLFVAFIFASGHFGKRIFASSESQKQIVPNQPVLFSEEELRDVSLKRTAFGVSAIFFLATGTHFLCGLLRAKINGGQPWKPR